MREKPKVYPKRISRSNPTPRLATSAAWNGASAIPPSKSFVPSPKPSVATSPPSVAGCLFRMSNFSQHLPRSPILPIIGSGRLSVEKLQVACHQEPVGETAPRGHVQTPRLAGPTPRLRGPVPRLVDPTFRLHGLTPRLSVATPRPSGPAPCLAAATPRLRAWTLRLHGSTPRLDDPAPRLAASTRPESLARQVER